jgi:hypothetical protein
MHAVWGLQYPANIVLELESAGVWFCVCLRQKYSRWYVVSPPPELRQGWNELKFCFSCCSFILLTLSFFSCHIRSYSPKFWRIWFPFYWLGKHPAVDCKEYPKGCDIDYRVYRWLSDMNSTILIWKTMESKWRSSSLRNCERGIISERKNYAGSEMKLSIMN